VDKDLVAEAIRKALKAVEAAQKAGYEDTRTSSTVCTDHLDSALTSMKAAAGWYADLRKEEKADERRPWPGGAKPKVETKEECHICGDDIAPGDVARCGGCDEPTCPTCMGDDGSCKKCESEPE
jgi:hypothetical protein